MNAEIIVIEDDPALLELIAYNLNFAGYEVTTADSAEAGQSMILQKRFELLILDWMLPGMSGIELCAQLRSSGHFPQLKILMLTARGQEVDRIRGISAGADEYLVKPFSVAEFLLRVEALLDGGGSTST